MKLTTVMEQTDAVQIAIALVTEHVQKLFGVKVQVGVHQNQKQLQLHQLHHQLLNNAASMKLTTI
mgnify:CR=1 FL=1